MMLNVLFGVDPSVPGDDVLGTIPQALFLMNGPMIHNRTLARPGTVLAEILATVPDDQAALGSLYLRVLSRYPNAQLSPQMKAFHLDDETVSIRDAYSRNPFGQGCLLARRLVEAGVTFVEVKSNGWDTHQKNNEKVANLAGQVDPAFATLIRDLKERGMLDRTLVVWMGEFGRTPKINGNAGRDHYPKVFNLALAGGGIKGGQVVGASSADGTEVKDHPITVPDLMATICHALHIDPTKETMTDIGRPIKVVDGGKVVTALF